MKNSSLQINRQYLMNFSKNSYRFLMWGFVLVILGILAISFATLTTLISVIFLGAIIFISGAITTIDTFTYWRHHWGGFILHLIMGFLYLAVGLMLIERPVQSTIPLTLLFGIFYSVIGISRIIYSLSLRLPRWGWSFLNGLIALLLGVLILAEWPASSLFIIGLFVGIDLLICGWAYIMVGLAAQNFAGR